LSLCLTGDRQIDLNVGSVPQHDAVLEVSILDQREFAKKFKLELSRMVVADPKNRDALARYGEFMASRYWQNEASRGDPEGCARRDVSSASFPFHRSNVNGSQPK
jgi:hypothetical protein